MDHCLLCRPQTFEARPRKVAVHSSLEKNSSIIVEIKVIQLFKNTACSILVSTAAMLKYFHTYGFLHIGF